MKMTKTMTFSILTIITTSLMLTIPSVSAETMISLPAGTAVPGCEETNECYIPYEVNVAVGETVTWSNDDTAAHTVTSGTASDGPDGIFDSSLFMASTTFSHTFEEEGTFDYFCMVHPWMVGSVIVGEASAEKSSEKMPEMKEMVPTKSASDMEIEFREEHSITGSSKVVNIWPDTTTNSVIVELDATQEGMFTITLPREVMDATINGEDDDFFVLVDGEEVDFEETKTDTDRTLTIGFPAGSEEIEIIGTFVVPEFGTIVVMILAVAIISIIAVSAKSRLSIMPRP